MGEANVGATPRWQEAQEGVGAVIDNGDVGYPGGDEPQAAAGGDEFGSKDAGEQVGDLAGA